jgi:hypothetical protein
MNLGAGSCRAPPLCVWRPAAVGGGWERHGAGHPPGKPPARPPGLRCHPISSGLAQGGVLQKPREADNRYRRRATRGAPESGERELALSRTDGSGAPPAGRRRTPRKPCPVRSGRGYARRAAEKGARRPRNIATTAGWRVSANGSSYGTSCPTAEVHGFPFGRSARSGSRSRVRAARPRLLRRRADCRKSADPLFSRDPQSRGGPGHARVRRLLEA